MADTFSLSGTFGLISNLVLGVTGDDDMTASDNCNLGHSWVIEDGDGDGQANDIFHTKYTLAAGATESIELNGVDTNYKNRYGDSLLWNKLKAYLVYSDADNGGTIGVGGGVNAVIIALDPINPTGSAERIEPNTGFEVITNTQDIFAITNNDTEATADVEVVLIGVKGTTSSSSSSTSSSSSSSTSFSLSSSTSNSSSSSSTSNSSSSTSSESISSSSSSS